MSPGALAGSVCVAAAILIGAQGDPGLRLRRRASVRSRRLSLGRVRAAIACVAGAAVVAFGVTAVLPVVVFAASGLLLHRRRQAAQRVRARQRQDREDVQALRALAAELRSGLPPPDALRAAAGSGADPAGLPRRMMAAAAADSLGGSAESALGAEAQPGSAAAAIAAAWAVCRVTGAGLAAPVSRIADAAAAQLRLDREAEAALASARSSARMLAALPVAGVGLGALSGTGSLRVLLATGPGQLCLLVGTALEFAGLFWLDRLSAGS